VCKKFTEEQTLKYDEAKIVFGTKNDEKVAIKRSELNIITSEPKATTCDL